MPVGTADRVIKEFNCATTLRAYKRARRMACFLPAPYGLLVIDSLLAARKRVAP